MTMHNKNFSDKLLQKQPPLQKNKKKNKKKTKKKKREIV